MRVGACVIGPDHWTDYQLPALRAMQASVVKVQLHDADGGWGVPWFTAALLGDLAGVVGPDGTIIIRTPETMIAPETLRRLFSAPLPGSATSLRDWLTSLPSYGPGVVVEVGNEPNEAGLDAWDHRQRLVSAATVLRGLVPRWVDLCAALATWRGRVGTDQAGDQYNRILLDVGQAQRPVLDLYDSLGVHGYGYHSLSRDEGEAWAVYDLAAATGKPLWWTEVGIAARQPWPQKMAEYRRFAEGLPTQVKGVTIFALSTAPEWTGDPCYGIDATDGVVDAGLPGCRVLSTPATPSHVPVSPPAGKERTMVSPVVDRLVPSFGYPQGTPGRGGQQPQAIVIHIMDGTLGGTYAHFSNPANGASSNYGIGRAGERVRYVQSSDAPWTNGDVRSPDLTIPWLRECVNRNVSPNRVCITIECEGHSGEPWPEVQYQAVLQTVSEELAANPQIVLSRDTVVGHYRINSVLRANCPGSNFPWDRLFHDLGQGLDLTAVAQSALLKDVWARGRAACAAAGAPDPYGLQLYEATADLTSILPALPKAARCLVCEKAVLWVGGAGQPDSFHRGQYEALSASAKTEYR